jgi:hypothetical protein
VLSQLGVERISRRQICAPRQRDRQHFCRVDQQRDLFK